MPVHHIYASSGELAGLASRALFVVPVGSLEQHCEAPVGADSLIAEAVARRACLRVEARGIPCVVLPVIAYGYSPEWRGTPGTISLSVQAFTGVVKSLVESLAEWGVSRIAFVNGHGGNSGLLEAGAREAARRAGVAVAVIDYWRVAGLRLGHCDGVEEALLRELVGVEAECACPRGLELPGYRVALPGSWVAGGGGGVTEGPVASRVVSAVAEALIDFYNRPLDRPAL